MASNRNVLDWLDRAAEVSPGKVAFSDESSQVTFGQACTIARKIGTELARRLGVTNKPIAVFIDRNVESTCCFLGIVASGNFYVPVDVTLPPARIESILDQMQPAAAIAIHGNAPSVDLPESELAILEYDELIETGEDDALLASIRESACDVDPLYAICTSGTTGTPKGVLIPHRSVLDFIPIFAETFGLQPDDVFGNQAPFDFDVSVKDIYSTLYLGASMHVIPRKCFSMPKLLAPLLDERSVTVIVWAVSALSIVAGFKAFKYCTPSSLRTVMFSGEVMPVKHLNYWRECLPDATFVNLYGPTEITCNCMYYIVDREFGTDERLPLGKPFRNERVFVLDNNDREIASDGEGEICVTGTCVGLGYYRNPERTAAAFVQNPLEQRFPEVMYRTGDLARYNERGELVYASRKDFQIKHMGHRIELEEIETHLNAVEGVERACCLFDEKRNKIVACVAGDRSDREIAVDLGKKLPKYMVPNVFYSVVSLPVTKNGKVDRKKLKEEYAS